MSKEKKQRKKVQTDYSKIYFIVKRGSKNTPVSIEDLSDEELHDVLLPKDETYLRGLIGLLCNFLHQAAITIEYKATTETEY